MGETAKRVSLVVPVYCGAATVGELVERVLAVFASRPEKCEVILVNDGSPDDSWSVIEGLADRHPEVVGLRLIRNFGQHNALLAGIRRARGEVIVTMDDDLQNPPEEIPKLLERLYQGHAVVYGVPEKGQHGMFRDFSSWFAKLALRFGLGFRHASDTSAFRAFRTQLREAFQQFGAKFVSIDVLLTWATNDFEPVEVAHAERARGQSGYSFSKLANHTLNMVTSFSSRPLKIAIVIGFLFMMFGIAVLFYVVGGYLFFDRVLPGFTFIASIVALFSGVQLFSLGIIGEYIGRIHQKALEQPCYVIAEQVGDAVEP